MMSVVGGRLVGWEGDEKRITERLFFVSWLQFLVLLLLLGCRHLIDNVCISASPCDFSCFFASVY